MPVVILIVGLYAFFALRNVERLTILGDAATPPGVEPEPEPEPEGNGVQTLDAQLGPAPSPLLAESVYGAGSPHEAQAALDLHATLAALRD